MFRNKMSRIMMIAIVFCITLSFVVLAVAGFMVPLKGSFKGLGNDFSGNFTHLGKFEGLLDPNTFTAEWTAANGDTVTNQTISFVFGEETETGSGIFNYTQNLVITGGTGRFDGATGEAEVVGLFDTNTGEYDGYLKGTISRPNSG